MNRDEIATWANQTDTIPSKNSKRGKFSSRREALDHRNNVMRTGIGGKLSKFHLPASRSTLPINMWILCKTRKKPEYPEDSEKQHM